MRAIDADKLLLKAQKVTSYDEGGWARDFNAVDVHDIQWAETVDPRKLGKWNPMQFGGKHYYRCSNCETGYVHTRYDYCPFCGAEMGVRE